MAARDLTFEKGLPASMEAEKLVLGAVLLDDANFMLVAGAVGVEDFALEKHKRIFASMTSLHEAGERVDRITLANDLMRRGQLESVDGFTYLVSLDDGL